MSPLAYHITFTTYGSWLHGDERNWVKSGVPGVQAPDPVEKAAATGKMAEPSVSLTPEQRAIVAQTIRDHCRIRGWTLHALHVGTVHIHVVVTAAQTPEEVMNQLKPGAHVACPTTPA